MKKRFFAVLCAALLLCTAALADSVKLPETAEGFDLSLALPDGSVFMTVQNGDGFSLNTVTAEGIAPVTITTAMSELYAGISLTDLTEADLDELAWMLGEQYEEIHYELETTENGMCFMHLFAGEDDVVNSYFTLYGGLMVQFTQYNDTFTPLTDADHDLMASLIAGIEMLK